MTIRNSTQHVYVKNPLFDLYLRGDEGTDDSIRFHLNDITSVQKRESGVWNDSKFRTGGSSLEIGRDLFIEAAGDYIKTVNPSNFDIHINSLLPHIPLSSGGTGFPHTPIVGATESRVIFSGSVGEVTNTTIGQAVTVTLAQIADKLVFETGSIGSSSPITLSVYTGTDNTGTLFLQEDLPANTFVANTTATVVLETVLGFGQNDTTVFIELVSSVAFSLDTDVSSNIILSFISQKILSRTMLYEDLILTNDAALIFNNDLEHVFHDQF